MYLYVYVCMGVYLCVELCMSVYVYVSVYLCVCVFFLGMCMLIATIFTRGYICLK